MGVNGQIFKRVYTGLPPSVHPSIVWNVSCIFRNNKSDLPEIKFKTSSIKATLDTVDSFIWVGTNFHGFNKTYMFVESRFVCFAEISIQSYRNLVICWSFNFVVNLYPRNPQIFVSNEWLMNQQYCAIHLHKHPSSNSLLLNISILYTLLFIIYF